MRRLISSQLLKVFAVTVLEVLKELEWQLGSGAVCCVRALGPRVSLILTMHNKS